MDAHELDQEVECTEEAEEVNCKSYMWQQWNVRTFLNFLMSHNAMSLYVYGGCQMRSV